MSIEELERDLGISFHDALLRTLSTDFVSRTAEMVLDVCVGDPGAPLGTERERRRRGRLVLTGLDYLAVDPRDPTYPYRGPGSVDVDSCAADPAMASRYPISAEAFAARLFVSDWNAFIHVAAMNATMQWLQPE